MFDILLLLIGLVLSGADQGPYSIGNGAQPLEGMDASDMQLKICIRSLRLGRAHNSTVPPAVTINGSLTSPSAA